MRTFARISSLWRNLSRRSKQDSDLAEELQAFIEALVERKIESGMPPEQARRSAMIEIGGIEQVKEQVREIRAGFLLETLWQDVRRGARSLMKSRGFALAAILSLGVGIGLNSAVFSAVHAVLLRPLPYRDPERLVDVSQTLRDYENGSVGAGVAPANFWDWHARNRSFEAMAIYDRINTRRVLLTPAGAAIIRGYNVSANFFQVLGVQPAIGRTFLPEEDRPDASVAVISDQLWRRDFARDPNVVGSSITVDDRSRTIIGVMGPEFRYYQPSGMLSDAPQIDIFLPYAFADSHPANRRYYLNSTIARLRRGVSVEKAQAEMSTIAQQLAVAYPEENKDSGILVSPLDFESSTTRSALLLAWGAMGILLLISAANVASLILVRTEARRHEMAIRLAIGAECGRVMRQMLTESLLVGIVGGVIGLALAWIGSKSIAFVLPNAEQIRRLDTATVDSNVVALTLLVSAILGLLCGFLPAIRASRSDLARSIQETGRTTSRLRTGVRFRSALVVLQIALSLVLLAGAGLMLKSILNLYQIRLGFQPDHLLTMDTRLPVRAPYATAQGLKEIGPGEITRVKVWTITPRSFDFPERVINRLLKVPGVESAAVASGAPMIRRAGTRFQIAGRPLATPNEKQRMAGALWYVTPGYFDVWRIRLLQGRNFDDRDTSDSGRVAIVNDFTAKTWWPNRARIVGERITLGIPPNIYEIVGVAADVRVWRDEETGPQLYLPLSQNVLPSYQDLLMHMRFQFHFAVRTSPEPASTSNAIRAAIRDVEKDVPLDRVRPMTEVIDRAFRPWRSTMLLFLFTGGLALLLAGVGIYGVISYVTTLRTHEIGIRVAVGANARNIAWLVMKRGVALVAVGAVVGIAAAFGLTRLIASQLFGVTPADPVANAGAALMLVAVALAACYLPARRACGMNPVVALRHE